MLNHPPKHFNCPCATAAPVEQHTFAEGLLMLAADVHRYPGELIEEIGGMPISYGLLTARCKFALDFERLGKGVHFRAIYEDWGQQRCLLETY
jgi:hypothetical protein